MNNRCCELASTCSRRLRTGRACAREVLHGCCADASPRRLHKELEVRSLISTGIHKPTAAARSASGLVSSVRHPRWPAPIPAASRGLWAACPRTLARMNQRHGRRGTLRDRATSRMQVPTADGREQLAERTAWQAEHPREGRARNWRVRRCAVPNRRPHLSLACVADSRNWLRLRGALVRRRLRRVWMVCHQVQEHEDAKARYRRDCESGKPPAEAYTQSLKTINAKLEVASHCIVDLENALANVDLLDVPTKTDRKDQHARLVESIYDGPVAARKALFTALVGSLTVHDYDDVRPTFRLGGPALARAEAAFSRSAPEPGQTNPRDCPGQEARREWLRRVRNR